MEFRVFKNKKNLEKLLNVLFLVKGNIYLPTICFYFVFLFFENWNLLVYALQLKTIIDIQGLYIVYR